MTLGLLATSSGAGASRVVSHLCVVRSCPLSERRVSERRILTISLQPYRNVTTHSSILLAEPPPGKPQHESHIRRSFVDPLPPSTTSSSSSSTKPPRASSALPSTSFPIALTYLGPARRGAWLIPLSGPFPIPSASTPRWFPSQSSPTSALSSYDPISKAHTIPWTDDRLKALWAYLSRIRASGALGPVDAVCYFATPGGMGDHVRVYTDAEFALGLRSLLRLVKVTKVAGGDTVQFLDEAKLAWVDERVEPILLA